MEQNLNVYEIKADVAGPNVAFLGAIHGSEPCGPAAIDYLNWLFKAGNLALTKGSVKLFPICNPEALKQKKRFVEEDLNRIFRRHSAPNTYEQNLANRLCHEISGSGIIIDIHSSRAAGEPFAMIAPAKTPTSNFEIELAQNLQVPFAVYGWQKALSQALEKKGLQVAPGVIVSSTATFARANGKNACVIECGQNGSKQAEEAALGFLKKTLRAFNMVEGPGVKAMGNNFSKTQTQILQVYDCFLYDGSQELLVPESNMHPVRQGDPVIKDGERIITASRDSRILFPVLKPEMNTAMLFLTEPVLGSGFID